MCPNDLILGKTTVRVPAGPFIETSSTKYRLKFIQDIINAGRNKPWVKFSSFSKKWHTAQRNLQVGDIVINQDSNQIKGNRKLGTLSTVRPGVDGKVRNVKVKYKNPKPNELPLNTVIVATLQLRDLSIDLCYWFQLRKKLTKTNTIS